MLLCIHVNCYFSTNNVNKPETFQEKYICHSITSQTTEHHVLCAPQVDLRDQTRSVATHKYKWSHHACAPRKTLPLILYNRSSSDLLQNSLENVESNDVHYETSLLCKNFSQFPFFFKLLPLTWLYTLKFHLHQSEVRTLDLAMQLCHRKSFWVCF